MIVFSWILAGVGTSCTLGVMGFVCWMVFNFEHDEELDTIECYNITEDDKKVAEKLALEVDEGGNVEILGDNNAGDVN